VPTQWPQIRSELEKTTGLTRSQLDRELRKLTRDGKLDPMQKNTGGGNARIVSEKDESTIRESVVALKANPRKVPEQLKRGREAAAAKKAETTSGGAGGNGSTAEGDREDQNLSARSLAESPGPRNTRKSALDAEKKSAEADDDDDADEPTSKKPWAKWLIIGGIAVVGGLALMAWMRRRQGAAVSAGGGGGEPAALQIAEPSDPQPLPDGGPTEEQRAALRAAGYPV
jgi:hypothetical protein